MMPSPTVGPREFGGQKARGGAQVSGKAPDRRGGESNRCRRSRACTFRLLFREDTMRGILQVQLRAASADLVGWYPRMICRQLAIATQQSNKCHGRLRSTVKDAISALRRAFRVSRVNSDQSNKRTTTQTLNLPSLGLSIRVGRCGRLPHSCRVWQLCV